MKIAQVNLLFPPVIGGLEFYIRDISAELVRRGHEVHVFTANRRGSTSLGPARQDLNGVIVHRLPVIFTASYRISFWPSLIEELLRGSFDIVHSYDQGQFSSLSCSLIKALGKLHSSFVITTYGPLETHSDYPAWKHVLLQFYDRRITSRIFMTADMVLARNPTIIPWIRVLGVPGGRVRMSPSGIVSQCLVPADGSRARITHNLGDFQVVGYVGRLNQQKGVQHLLKAFPRVLERIPQAVLVLAGPDEGMKTQLETMVEELGLKDRVRIMGPMIKLETELELIAAFDVFAMPSSFEGFSQAVLKAMAQAKPVVATNVGGLSWQVRDGTDGFLVPYGDHVALARALSETLDERKKAKEMGANGRERARGFTYPRLARELEAAYVDVLSGQFEV